MLSAKVVLGTKYGTAVRVAYCFRSFSTDPDRGPWRLSLTVDNLRDQQPPLNIPWEVTTRCGTIIHPVGGIQQPYVLRYQVDSRNGTRSNQRTIRLAELPALNRKPDLPQRIDARLVTGTEYGKAVRISYCFRSQPKDLSRRPWRLPVTILSASNRDQSHGYEALVRTRCGTLTYPVVGIDPPYVVSYVVVSKNGTYSKRAQVAVR
jgi:hypothetical protein